MQTIKTLYELTKKHWILFCVSLIVLITVFYSTNTKKVSQDYSSYIKSEEGKNSGISPTSPPDQIPVLSQEDMKALSEGEALHRKRVQELFQKYPWYQKIPIIRDEYIVDYNFEKESFRIVLKISEVSSQAQKDSAVNKALQDIKNIGADPKNYYVRFAQETEL
jgi:hypothetical protein